MSESQIDIILNSIDNFSPIAGGVIDLLAVGMVDAFGEVTSAMSEFNAVGMESGATFETYTMRLDQLLGGAAQAQERMASLQNQGLVNPNTLSDLANMDTRLTNMGLDVQDTAAKVGHSGESIRQTIMDATAAVSKSAEMNGQTMNRIAMDIGKYYQTGSQQGVSDLIRLGVTTKEQLTEAGAQWDAHGKMIGDTANNVDLLINAINTKYGGMAQKSMDTMSGIKSNWEDMTQFIARTVTGSELKDVEAFFSSILANLNTDQAKAAYQEIGDSVGRVIDSFQIFFGTIDSHTSQIPDLLTNAASALSGFADDINGVAMVTGNVFTNILGPLKDQVVEMYDDGKKMITQWINGIEDGAGALADVFGNISGVVSDWFTPHSPPKIAEGIDQKGTDTINLWVKGMTSPDLTMFQNLSGQVKTLIEDMGKTGEVDKLGVIPRVIGTDSGIAEAIQNLKDTGTIGAHALKMIDDNAGSAAGKIKDLLQTTADDQKATEDLATAKATLASINKQYADDSVTANNAIKDSQDALVTVNKNYASDMRELQGFIDTNTAAQQNLNQAYREQNDALQSQIDVISSKQQEVALDQKLADLADQKNQTGKYADTAARAALTLHDDQIKATLADNAANIAIEKKHQEINALKAKGKDTSIQQLELDDLITKQQLSQYDAKARIASDQDKIADLAPSSGAAAKLDEEAKKLKLQQEQKKLGDDHKKELEPLQAEANSLSQAKKQKDEQHKEDVANAQEKIDKAKEYKATLDETHKTAVDAQDKLIKAAQDHKNLEDSKLKILQEQNKIYSSNLDMLTKQATLEDQAEKAAAAHHAAGIGGGHKKKQDTTTTDHGAAETHLENLNKIGNMGVDVKGLADANAPNSDGKLRNPLAGKGSGVDIQALGGAPAKALSGPDKDIQDAMAKGQAAEDAKNRAEGIKNKIEDTIKQIKGDVDAFETKIGSIGEGFAKFTQPIDTFVSKIKEMKDDFDKANAPIDHFRTSIKDTGDACQVIVTPITTIGAQTSQTQNTMQIAVSTFNNFKDSVMTMTETAIKPMLPHLTHIGEEFGKIGDQLGPKIGPALGAIKDGFVTLTPVIGTILSIAIVPLLAVVNGLISAFDEALPYAATTVGDALAVIGDYFKIITDVVKGVGKVVQDVFHGDFGKAFDDAKSLIGTFFSDIGTMFHDQMVVVGDVIVTGFHLIKGYISGWVDEVIGLATSLWDSLVGHSIFPDIMTGITGAFTGMIATVVTDVTDFISGGTGLIARFGQFELDVIGKITDTATGIVKGLKSGLDTAISNVEDFISGPVGVLVKIGQFEIKVFTATTNVGKSFIDGITKGIGDAWASLTGFIHEKVSSLPDWAAKAIGAQSPSKDSADKVGNPFTMGIVKGALDSMPFAQDEIGKMMGSLIDQASGKTGGARGSFLQDLIPTITTTISDADIAGKIAHSDDHSTNYGHSDTGPTQDTRSPAIAAATVAAGAASNAVTTMQPTIQELTDMIKALKETLDQMKKQPPVQVNFDRCTFAGTNQNSVDQAWKMATSNYKLGG